MKREDITQDMRDGFLAYVKGIASYGVQHAFLMDDGQTVYADGNSIDEAIANHLLTTHPTTDEGKTG